ncbi:MAG: thiosulfate oxidation carrier complex protein SoxZ [Proteobacteria bacterium]|nr:thiosulfate oxidation carrier complex protein SoxZ [Pseudomonadota bacterium]
MADGITRVAVPETAAKGEIIEIKALASHPMDNGFMFRDNGTRIPRWIIHRFEVDYNDELIFAADWHVAISANPYISFHTIATESGTINFRWFDDNGDIYTESAKITVV